MKQPAEVKYIFISLAAFAFLSFASVHQDYVHHKPKPALSSSREEKRQISLHQINETYRQTVKPIFKKSCFDCHSDQTRYPWYYKIPGAKGIVDSDVAEAKKHIDLTNDFPLQGHGSPEEDLPAIRKTLEEGTMPPFRYRVLHLNSSLTPEEKRKIDDWIEKSIELLTTE